MFKLFDINEDGNISKIEMLKVFKCFDFVITEQDVDVLMKGLDVTGQKSNFFLHKLISF